MRNLVEKKTIPKMYITIDQIRILIKNIIITIITIKIRDTSMRLMEREILIIEGMI